MATTSIDNIFDDDDVEITSHIQPSNNDVIELDDDAPAPTRRPRQPLFLADSDDDDMDVDLAAQGRNVLRPPSPQEIDIDGIFGDFGDFDDDMPVSSAPLDEDAMMRAAEARARKTTTLHEILPSSSPIRNRTDNEDDDGPAKKSKKKSAKDGEADEKKAKRRIMKLDENRLLGPSGFPELVKMTKDFKIKGKGHEATDLNRLLQVYQYWTHQLYPKTQFRDTVERVEKLTHSRRMHVALSVWKDEAKGIQPKDTIDESEDEDTRDGNRTDNDTREDPRQSERPSSSRSSPLPASSPPLSPRAITGSSNETRASDRAVRGGAEPLFLQDDDEEALWNAMDEFEAEEFSSVPPSAPISAANSSMDDDDDLWNMADEMHNEPNPPKAPGQDPGAQPGTLPKPADPPAPVQQPPEDDDDDMYV